jgi:hypothetical protein
MTTSLFTHDILCENNKKYKSKYIPQTTNENMAKLIKQVIDYDTKNIKTKSSFVILPVNIIDGINVKTELLVNTNGISLYIRSEKVYIYEKDKKQFNTVESIILRYQLLFRKTYIKKLKEYTLDDYIDVLKHVNEDICKMHLNKLEGVLYTPEILHPRDVPHVCRIDEMDNQMPYDTEPDMCCVCFDSTKTTTICRHKLCVFCWNNIKNNGRHLPCPICRTNLKNINTKTIIGYNFNTNSEHNANNIDMYYVTDSDSEEQEQEDQSILVVDRDEDNETEYNEDYDEFPSMHYNFVLDMY